MRIISEKAIRKFVKENPSAQNIFNKFKDAVLEADWTNFSDLRETFNSADIYKNCVVFNVGGNKYRVIGIVEYEKHLVFIRAILIHKEYDKDKWKPDCEK